MMSSPLRAVRTRACAKINVTLRLLGIRDDGYHELRTTFQSLALHDTLTFTRQAGPFVLESDDEGCPLDESNLVWRAAARLWRASGRRSRLHGIRAHITKRIPMQAGLGGGSSDAAAALRALAVLWGLQLPPARLVTIARELGADVPFFLEGGTVLGVERGDLLFPLLDAPGAWVVVAVPDFGVSTRDAYAWWDEEFTTRRSRAGRSAVAEDEATNDLQAPVEARYPRISRLVSRLRAAGASRAAMSGSGSAVFGLFATRAAAELAAANLSGRKVTLHVTRTLSRREFQRVSAVHPAG